MGQDVEAANFTGMINRSIKRYFFLSLLCATGCGITPDQLPGLPAAIMNIPAPLFENSTPYDRYCNARFEYCIDYPPQLLIKQRESDNGDGCRFLTHQKEVFLTVFGRLYFDASGNPISLNRQYKDDLQKYTEDNAVITYKKLGKTFYIISGLRQDGQIFYQKTLQKTEAFAFAIITYPAARKADNDGVTARITASFK